MSFTEKHIEWFDDYLSGNLDEKNLINFKKTLAEDPILKNEFESYKTFCAQIEASFSTQLKADILQGEKNYLKKIRLRKITFITLAALCLLSILGILIMQNKSTKALGNDVLTHENNQSEQKIAANTSSNEGNEKLETLEREHKNIETNNTQRENVGNETKSPTSNYIVQKQYFLLPYPTLKVYYSGDTIVIESDKDINKVVAFEMENKSYLRINDILYYQYQERFLIAEKDTRVAELISKSTGRGKAQLIKIKQFQINEKTTEIEKSDQNKSKLFFLNNMEISEDDFLRFSKEKVLELKTHFFTLEDLYNLNSN